MAKTFTITSSTATDVVSLGDEREDVRGALGGVQLLVKSLDDVESELAAKDINISRDDMGAMIASVSVGLHAPAGTVEGVQLGSD